MKHQIIHTLQKYVLNPPIQLDVVNDAFNVHSVSMSSISTATGQTARARGVPLSMSRIQPEFLGADPSSRSRPTDVLVREEPEDEEDEDDRNEEDDEDKEDDEGYSE